MENFPELLDRGFGPPVALERERLLLVFRKPIPRTDLEDFLKTADLRLEPDLPGDAIGAEHIGHTDRIFWVQATSRITEERYAAIERTGAKLLDWIAPVYRVPGHKGRKGLLTVLPNVLVVTVRASHGGPRAPLPAAIAKWPGLSEVHELSEYLNGAHFLRIDDPRQANAYRLRGEIAASEAGAQIDIRYENVPMVLPLSALPNDPLFSQQWNMNIIGAPLGWDISTGNPSVTICVIDYGCDLTHPDLVAQIFDQGITAGLTLYGTGVPLNPSLAHGTACAGLAVATYNNATGLAGLAGGCALLPITVELWGESYISAAINWAVSHGADVISMSFGFGPNFWDPNGFTLALQDAIDANVVLCAAAGNDMGGPVEIPANDPRVMAVGASDMFDNRADFSNYGPELSVVAPGVSLITTDNQGADGYGPGDYINTFGGTSGATPQVAGLAGLLRSAYPGLTNVQIRSIIERTAVRQGNFSYSSTYPFADTPGYPNGTWCLEMGYGRINIFRALDFADVFIRDNPSDDGTEPSADPNFWEFSDIVVRPTDDGIFTPSDPSQSRYVELGQDNYVYVQVTNNGPATARNVEVSTRIMPHVGLQFVYPVDWTAIDATHIAPTPVLTSFTAIPAGGTVLAKFRIDTAQTVTLLGPTNAPWHPCMVAMVTSENDYAFDPAPLSGEAVVRRNNLAQRNLTVVDTRAGLTTTFPFVAGHALNRDREMKVEIDRSRLPRNMPLLLALDGDGEAFPQLGFEGPPIDGDSDDRLTFLTRTRLRTSFAGRRGELTLEKGSHFDPQPDHALGKVTASAGDVILRGGKRYIEIRGDKVTVAMEKAPGGVYPLTLQTVIPEGAEAGDQFAIRVAQLDREGKAVGGATVIYVASRERPTG